MRTEFDASDMSRLNVAISSTYPEQGRDSEGSEARFLFEGMTRYRNDLLINKLCASLSLSKRDANLLFDDLKRFIALCATEFEPLAPPRVVDEGWHYFILQTKDYAAFCDEFCGRFIHHQPADPAAEVRDYTSDRRRTRERAATVFGTLSGNWDELLTGGKCTHNCGTGD